MDEVVGKVSSMKSVIAALQWHYTKLPLAVAVLERRLLHNVDVEASTSTDYTAVITEYGD